MSERSRFAAALFAALAAGPAAAAGACHVGIIAELPVTMSGEQPTVPARINGHDVRFVADSGAFFSLISPASAAEFDLKLLPAPFLEVEGVGGNVRAFVTTVKTFTHAGVDIPRVDFIVGGSDTGRGTVGLLGQNILRLADVEYDLANGVIRLMRPKDCGDRVLAYWITTEPFSALPIGQTSPSSPHTTAAATVNGANNRHPYDSGAAMSIHSLAGARRAGIAIHGHDAIDGGLVSGLGRRSIQTWIVPVASFKIGGEEIRNTRLRVGDTGLPDTEMTLGDDFFLSHHIYVANGQGKLYFTYNGGPVFNLAGGALAQLGPTAAAKPSTIAPHGAAPTDAAGFARRAAAFAGRRDWALAIADYDKAIAMDGKQADYFLARGEAHFVAGEPLQAAADLDQALALRPDLVPALLVRASLHLRDSAPARTLADLDAADRAAARQDNARLAIADLYLAAEAYPKALAQYDLWIGAHREDVRLGEALNGRCWARAQLDVDLSQALADCNGALKARPKSPEVLDSRGLVRLRQGDFAGAIADYDAALAASPKIAWSLYGRGLAKLKTGQAAAGKADLAAAATLDPALPEKARKAGLAP